MSYNTKNYTEQGGDVTRFGGKVVFEEGCVVEGLSGATLEPATATTLGGVMVGNGLSITEAGKLSVAGAANQAASTATDAEGLVADFNALLTKLKAAGLMAADS